MPSLTELWSTTSRKVGAGDAVYVTLRQAIMSGVLAPGDRLNEEELAAQFEVTRTPICEGILRLETEQFATRIPRRGLVVRSITEQEVKDSYAVRGALDGLAARLTAERALPPERAELRALQECMLAAHAQADTEALHDLSERFHDVMARATHNEMLMSHIRQNRAWVNRFGARPSSNLDRAREIIQEHHLILYAIEAGDPDLAGSVARHHAGRLLETRSRMMHDEATPSTQP